jgi:hypothetical protein
MDGFAKLRQRFSLPEHHLTSFGSASLDSGLILAHFKRTGDRVPLNGDWARTDSFLSDGDRLSLGDFDALGLNCDSLRWDGHRGPDSSCFPLGVEFGA